MDTLSFSEAREHLSDVVNRVRYGHERIALTRHGKEVAALVSMEDVRLLEWVIEELEDRLDIKAAEEALERIEKDGTVPFEEVMKDLDLPD